jgi:hypothetical protein
MLRAAINLRTACGSAARASKLAVAIAVALLAEPATADRDLCTSDHKPRGAAIDLDVKAADIQDVLRMLADSGHVNLAMAAEITGKVTLKLKRVAWDQAACVIADLFKLSITIDGNVLLVRRRDAK